MDKAKERLQRIIRTEIYANKVKQLFFDTVNEITALSKSLPVLEEGVMFSFEGENRKKQLQVERALRKLHSFATVAIENGINLEWEEANKTCDELLSTQFGKASLESSFFKAWALRNHDVRDSFAKRIENGMNLSQRIWKYVDQFRDEMEIAMTVAISEGESASEMSRKVRQYLQDPDLMFRRFRYKVGEDADGNPIYGKKWKKKVRDDNGKVRWIDYDKDSYQVGKGMYKSAYKNAMRVARTETNMAYRKADNVRWQQMDFVVGQRISLSKKHPCEDICDDLAGEYPKSFVFTGWHPQCFCYVTPILGDEDEMAKITDAFVNGEEYEPQFEQLEKYPKGFQRWVKDHKKQINDSISRGKEPYFIKDNRKAIEGIIDSKRAKINNASLQGNNSNKYRGTGAKRIINQIPDAISRSLISKQYSKLTTHLEVAEKLKNNLSVQFGHNVNVTIIPENIKLELAKIYATELSNLSKQYKLTQGKLTDIIMGYLPDDANEYGATNINARTKNKTLYLRGEIVSRHSKYAFENSRCDKRKIAQSLVTHEFGHLIHQFKPQTSGDGLLFRTSIEKKYNDYLYVSKKLIHDKKINDFAEISLGIKAHSGGIDEFFAEAFQEYKNCRCPSKYAIAVGEIIEKFFGI